MKASALIWVLLTVATLLSFYLTDSSTLSWITGLILALTAIKGHLIVDGFMELHGVRHWVRTGLLLYCPLLGLVIWLILNPPF